MFKQTQLFWKDAPGTSGLQDFLGFSILRQCGSILIACAHARGLFSIIFLHFLQKYRCVLKIGFSADISINIFIDIFIDISIGISIDISDICIDISIDILIGICVDFLIDKEEGRGGKEGRSGSFLKI